MRCDRAQASVGIALALLTIALSGAPALADNDICENASFVVRRGDSLWKISREFLIAAGRESKPMTVKTTVLRIYSDNQALIGPNPNRLRLGQHLVIGPLKTCKLLPDPSPAEPPGTPSYNTRG